MRGKEDHVGLVEIVIILYRVVDDDGEEDDRTANQAVYEGVGELAQPRFLVEGVVGAEQGIEKQPAQGDGDGTQPEAGGQQEPVIDENGLGQQYPAAKMKNIGGQNGRDIVAKDIPKDRDGM